MKRMLLAFTFGLVSVSSHAQFIEDGNRLYRELRNPDNDLAVGYVAGIADAEELLRRAGAKAEGMEFACVASDITATQLTAVVRKYLEDHVQLRHLGAAALVRLALRSNYPCK